MTVIQATVDTDDISVQKVLQIMDWEAAIITMYFNQQYTSNDEIWFSYRL